MTEPPEDVSPPVVPGPGMGTSGPVGWGAGAGVGATGAGAEAWATGAALVVPLGWASGRSSTFWKPALVCGRTIAPGVPMIGEALQGWNTGSRSRMANIMSSNSRSLALRSHNCSRMTTEPRVTRPVVAVAGSMRWRA